jgi:hypothetical protein
LPAFADVAPSIPACPLLTVDEVGTTLGVAVEAAEQLPSGGREGGGRMTTCLWTPAGGRLGATLSLVVWTWPPGNGRALGYLAALREATTEFPDRPPPDTLAVGDDAVWDGDRLHVRLGEVNYTLATSLNALDATPDAKAKLQALALLVAARL